MYTHRPVGPNSLKKQTEYKYLKPALPSAAADTASVLILTLTTASLFSSPHSLPLVGSSAVLQLLTALEHCTPIPHRLSELGMRTHTHTHTLAKMSVSSNLSEVERC